MHPLSPFARALICGVLSSTVCIAASGCGDNTQNAKVPANACKPKSLPVGHWSGEWESYPMSNPDSVRSGSIDLVVSEGGIAISTVTRTGVCGASSKGSQRISDPFPS